MSTENLERAFVEAVNDDESAKAIQFYDQLVEQLNALPSAERSKKLIALRKQADQKAYMAFLKARYIAANLRDYKSASAQIILDELKYLNPSESERNDFTSLLNPVFMDDYVRILQGRIAAFNLSSEEGKQQAITFLTEAVRKFELLETDLKAQDHQDAEDSLITVTDLFSSKILEKIQLNKKYCETLLEELKAFNPDEITAEFIEDAIRKFILKEAEFKRNTPEAIQSEVAFLNEQGKFFGWLLDKIKTSAELMKFEEQVKKYHDYCFSRADYLAGFSSVVSKSAAEIVIPEVVPKPVKRSLFNRFSHSRAESVHTLITGMVESYFEFLARGNRQQAEIKLTALDHFVAKYPNRKDFLGAFLSYYKCEPVVQAHYEALCKKYPLPKAEAEVVLMPLKTKTGVRGALRSLVSFFSGQNFKSQSEAYLYRMRRAFHRTFRGEVKFLSGDFLINFVKFIKSLEPRDLTRESSYEQKPNAFVDGAKACLERLSDAELIELQSNFSHQAYLNLSAAIEFSSSARRVMLGNSSVKPLGELHRYLIDFNMVMMDVFQYREIKHDEKPVPIFATSYETAVFQTPAMSERLEDRITSGNQKGIQKYLKYISKVGVRSENNENGGDMFSEGLSESEKSTRERTLSV